MAVIGDHKRMSGVERWLRAEQAHEILWSISRHYYFMSVVVTGYWGRVIGDDARNPTGMWLVG